MSTQLSPSTLLAILELWLRNYDFSAPDDKQAPRIFNEYLDDLEISLEYVPEATEYFQTLQNNAYLMYKASKESNLDEGKKTRQAALTACGILQRIRLNNNLA